MPLTSLAPLATLPDVAFISLQKGTPSREVGDWPGPAPLIDAEPMLNDFEDTAAMIAALDVVVTVDTSVANLCGAMGRSDIAMLRHSGAEDWRWGVEGAPSPWYPTLRLFRQPSFGDWRAVAEKVRAALE